MTQNPEVVVDERRRTVHALGKYQVLACSPEAASKVFEQAAEESPMVNARVMNCISVE
jgi:hypothetical protein